MTDRCGLIVFVCTIFFKEKAANPADRDCGGSQARASQADAGPGATAERGALVLVGGRTVYAEKNAELLFDLKDAGFFLYIYDHRSQGLSGRLICSFPTCRVYEGEKRNTHCADLPWAEEELEWNALLGTRLLRINCRHRRGGRASIYPQPGKGRSSPQQL
jgi:hypothetical protein